MDVFVIRWEQGHHKNGLFLWSINLDGNHCSIKDNRIEVGLEIYNCILMWLQQEGRQDIYQWLKEKEGEIAGKYNEVRKVVIDGLKDQIKKEELKLIT